MKKTIWSFPALQILEKWFSYNKKSLDILASITLQNRNHI